LQLQKHVAAVITLNSFTRFIGAKSAPNQLTEGECPNACEDDNDTEHLNEILATRQVKIALSSIFDLLLLESTTEVSRHNLKHKLEHFAARVPSVWQLCNMVDATPIGSSVDRC